MLLAYQDDTGISDNNWLDQFRIPVGDWWTQTVDWIDENLGWLLNAIKWPFQTLFDFIMNENPARTSIMSISWIWLVLGFFLLGSVLRNTRIGFMSAAMVTAIGFLAQDIWLETSKTFGMIFISVLLCAAIGLPLGILCGRFDSVWNVTRPVLDAMQVVHSFVWMLPFIAFWGIGNVSATMVTMMFAMPPLVRLTNLGIRQVPEDVVEASRSYGANEFRVLTDVQLPLARPAIMTGLNQTLLLAISMLGIAAFMGADGLGRLIYRAINNLDTALAASSGLAFFFVAVVLDRITQPETGDGMSLFGRITHAWSNIRTPEELLSSHDATPEAVDEPAERPVPVSARERSALLVVAGASVLSIIGVFLPWASNAGVISGWGSAADENLDGLSFSGLHESGGSFFGIFVIVFSVIALLAAVRPLLTFKSSIVDRLVQGQGALLAVLGGLLALMFVLNLASVGFDGVETVALAIFSLIAVLVAIETFVGGTPRLGADGAAICALAAFGAAFGYALASPSAESAAYSRGIGVWVTLLGCVIAIIGSVMALRSAPYAPHRPLPTGVSVSSIVGAVIAFLLVWGGATAAWMVDEREGFRNREFFGGLAGDGPGLGWPTLVLAVIAAAGALILSGVVALDESNKWRLGALTAGFGAAAFIVPIAWTFSISRSGDADYFNDRLALTGAGVLLALSGAFIFFSIGRSNIAEFRRRKIYADVRQLADEEIKEIDISQARELVGSEVAQ